MAMIPSRLVKPHLAIDQAVQLRRPLPENTGIEQSQRVRDGTIRVASHCFVRPG
jgi:hypothetical protein